MGPTALVALRIGPYSGRVVTRTLAALAVVGVALVAAHLSGAASTAETGVVASVYDGDTLALTDGRRVRLLQIDTPELGSGECYSRAARTALLSLAPLGTRIALEADGALDRTDRYGRLLRYVRREAVNVNLELVRRGAAAPYFYGRAEGGMRRRCWRPRDVRRRRSSASGRPARPPCSTRAAQSRRGRAARPRRRRRATGKCDPELHAPVSPRIRPISTAQTSARSASLRFACSAPIRTGSMATTTGWAASRAPTQPVRDSNCDFIAS